MALRVRISAKATPWPSSPAQAGMKILAAELAQLKHRAKVEEVAMTRDDEDS